MAMVEHGPADDGLLGWQEPGDAGPLVICQREVNSREDVHPHDVGLGGLTMSASSCVAGFGDCLVMTPKRGPRQPAGELFRGLGD